MKASFGLFAVFCALSTTASTYASPLVTDSFNIALVDGGYGSGTVTVDSGAGTVQNINFTVVDNSTTYTFNSVHYQNVNGSQYYADSYDAAGDALLFAFQGSSLVGFTSSDPLCTQNTPCVGLPSFLEIGGTTVPILVTGDTPTVPVTLGAPAVAPEPSSLLLLGTGVLGVGGMLRRRFVKA